jgi:hypothetical protein
MFLWNYFNQKKKNDSPLSAMFGTLINMGIPFTLLLETFLYILSKIFKLKILSFTHNMNRFEVILIFILPVIAIVKICNYSIKQLEQIELSENDFQSGKTYYFSFLIFAGLILFIAPSFVSNILSLNGA